MGRTEVVRRGDHAAEVSELFIAHRRLVGLAALLVDEAVARKRSCRRRS